MKRNGTALIILCLLILLPTGLQSYSQETKSSAPKPLETIKDIMAWKSIGPSVISDGGQWFGYRLSPAEGDGEVIFRSLNSDKEYKFQAGEGRGGQILFSADSRFAAFTLFPTAKEAKSLRKQKKKIYNSLSLINLGNGEKTDFANVRSFAFSGENPDWIAMHKYPPEGQAKEKDKWSGSDLILSKIGTDEQFNVGNVSEFAFDKKGIWLAWAIDALDQSGNGIQARHLDSGVSYALDSGKAEYKHLNWTERGDGLAVLKGCENDNYEDKLFSVLGFTGFGEKAPSKVIYNPVDDPSFPEGMTISPNRSPVWTDGMDAILFGIHEVKKKEKKEKDPEEKNGEEIKKQQGEEKEQVSPPSKKSAPAEKEVDKEDLPELVIWHWKDKRLQSMQQVQANRDKNFSYLCIFRTKEKKFIRLADDNVPDVFPAPKHLFAIGQDDQKYERMGNLDGRRYQDIYIFDLKTGERNLALEKARWVFSPSPDGTHFLYYQEGDFYTYDMTSGKIYNITKDVPTSFINTEDDHNVIDPPINPYAFGWTEDGRSLLLYDNWDVWHIPVHGGNGINLTMDGKEKNIRYRSRFRLDPEEKGIDLKKPLYLNAYGEWTKKAGIAVITKGKAGPKMLIWDDAVFSLEKAKDADVFLMTRQTHKDYPDYFLTDASLKKAVPLTKANPQQEDFLWSSGTKLIDYQSAKGDKLQAALFLPADYEEGKSYPTMVYFYEKSSQNLNRYYAPSARGFNKSVYTSRGYAVLMPDIVYKVDDPGMSAVWCVLPAIEAAVKTGIVDRKHIGVHGHSWGGYQSSFLITQTDVFAACVTGAPLTNMISMYSSIYWNSGSANQPIFESSQGRFSGGFWENMDAYIRNSPVFFAENVKTPTIILHNDKDGAVDWNQGIEYFNTLRRLGKPVVMLQYVGENHGLRKVPNLKDYTIRMREFFDHFLMGKPAPKWWEEGVGHLELEDHIKERTKQIK